MRFWSNTESSDTAVAVVIPNEERDLSRFVLREKSVLSVKSYYVYVLTNWNQRVMYVGVTSDLKRRIHEHQNKLVKGFTEKYNVNKLVYYEQTNDVITALAREKEIKKWRRQKKDNLVVSINPQWQDLSAYL